MSVNVFFSLRHKSHRTADVFIPTVLYVAWRLPYLNKQQCHFPLKVERCELFVRPCTFHTIRNSSLTSALWAGMDSTYHSQQILISTPSGIKNTSTMFGCDQLHAPTALLPGRCPRFNFQEEGLVPDPVWTRARRIFCPYRELKDPLVVQPVL